MGEKEMIWDGYEYTGETDGENRPHGKGVLSDEEGEVYEGYFVHGKREGKGTEYDEYGYACYVGEWKDDMRDGEGSEYVAGKIVYDGMWRKGHAEGFGRSFDDEGEILYEGEWKNDEPVRTEGGFRYDF
ncbi:MAG: hypothetical protein ACI4U2_06935 [Christensenellaceae bacterium]